VNLPAKTEVLIVGAGPVGLTLAGLLARQGVASIVVEKRTGELRAPAAHVLRNGPRAVLALLGIDADIEASVPDLPMHFITWCTTLGGSELGRIDLRKGREDRTDRPWTNLSQNRLEPILAGVVGSHARTTIVRGATCTDVSQTEASATAKIVADDGVEQSIEADWIVAADGAGSRIRKALGIELEGVGPLGKFFMVHFKADLSPWIDHRPGPIFWIMHPDASGTLIVHDKTNSHVFMTPMSGVDGEEAAIPARLAEALGIDLDVEILAIDRWTPYCQVASRYREGRVLLLGDAAHRFPPSGGLGLNTGLMEAHNLAWKLALVQSGRASTGLLDSYERECRPAANANAQDSLRNAMQLGLITEAMGGCFTLEAMHDRLKAMSADEQTILADAIEAQRSHFMSNGRCPEPGGDLDCVPALRWPTDYGGFELHTHDTALWEDGVAKMPDLAGMTCAVRPLPRDCATRLADTPMTFLTRPDGVVIWRADDGACDTEPLHAAIIAAVGVMSKQVELAS
jgi:2-polyprenyl-6-methoxyphenol hydroxylase-like FAD-dependent oxidoreductase